VRGTFVNANHFGALACLAAPCALAIGLSERWLRPWMFVAVIVLNVGIVLSLSRSAIVAGVVGQGLVFVLDRVARRGVQPTEARKGARITLAVAVAGAVIAAGVVGAYKLEPKVARLAGELGSDGSKVGAWRDAVELVPRYAWTGVGRGAFEQAFTQVSTAAGRVRYPFIENGYLQAVLDWGLVVGLLLVVLAAMAFVRGYRRAVEDPLGVAAFAGIVALAVHEAADFAVEIPGVALPALAVLATLFARSSSGRSDDRGWLRPRPLHAIVPLGVLAAALVATQLPRADRDAGRLARLATDPGVSPAALLAAGEAVRARHPADYFVHTVVGDRLARARHPDALHWLNDALYLNPRFGPAHLAVADVLAAAGRKPQALLEYRTAAAAMRDPRDVWKVAARDYGAFEDLWAMCPDDVGSRLTLGEWLWNQGRTDDALRVYERILETAPHNVHALQQLAHAAKVRKDPVAMGRHVAALAAVDRSLRSRQLAVEARLLGGDLAGAAALLAQESARDARTFELELALAEARARGGLAAEARARLDHIGKTWVLTRAAMVRLHETKALVERFAGNDHQSRWELEQAQRLRTP
jgi:tetratricopeptide (TPR) repeat protein